MAYIINCKLLSVGLLVIMQREGRGRSKLDRTEQKKGIIVVWPRVVSGFRVCHFGTQAIVFCVTLLCRRQKGPAGSTLTLCVRANCVLLLGPTTPLLPYLAREF